MKKDYNFSIVDGKSVFILNWWFIDSFLFSFKSNTQKKRVLSSYIDWGTDSVWLVHLISKQWRKKEEILLIISSQFLSPFRKFDRQNTGTPVWILYTFLYSQVDILGCWILCDLLLYNFNITKFSKMILFSQFLFSFVSVFTIFSLILFQSF